MTDSLNRIRASAAGLWERAARVARAPMPSVGIELSDTHATLVRVQKRRRKVETVACHEVEIPAGALEASMARANLRDVDVVRDKLSELLDGGGQRPGKVGVSLSDSVARVSVLELGELPGSRRDIEEMIRWKLKKSVPFRIEDARVSYEVLSGPGGGPVSLLSVVVLNQVVERYEQLLESVGLSPGVVGLASLHLANLFMSTIASQEPDESTMVMNCNSRYATQLVFRGSSLRFYRCKAHADAFERDTDSAFRFVGREVASSLEFYRERMQGGDVRRVLLRAVDIDPDRLVDELAQGVDAEISWLDPRRAVELPDELVSDGAMLQRIAPALGATIGATA